MSISLGLWTFLLSYLISIPLGVAKAVREGSRFDTATTLLVLVGFALPGLRARRAADRAVRGRHLPRLVSVARSHLRQLGEPELARAYRRLPVASRAAAHVLRDRQLRHDHVLTKNTFVEEIRKQYVLVARAKGRLRAQRAVQARVPQRADPDHHRLSGCIRRRLLRGIAADRDAVLARRPRVSRLRIDCPARLSRSCSARCTSSR